MTRIYNINHDQWSSSLPLAAYLPKSEKKAQWINPWQKWDTFISGREWIIAKGFDSFCIYCYFRAPRSPHKVAATYHGFDFQSILSDETTLPFWNLLVKLLLCQIKSMAFHLLGCWEERAWSNQGPLTTHSSGTGNQPQFVLVIVGSSWLVAMQMKCTNAVGNAYSPEKTQECPLLAAQSCVFVKDERLCQFYFMDINPCQPGRIQCLQLMQQRKKLESIMMDIITKHYCHT